MKNLKLIMYSFILFFNLSYGVGFSTDIYTEYDNLVDQEIITKSVGVCINNLPDQGDKRKRMIKLIFSNPKVSMFDLSKSNIGEYPEDIDNIVYGLACRSKNQRVDIKLIDMSNKHIKKQDVLNLIKQLNKKYKFSNGESETIELGDSLTIGIPNEIQTIKNLEKWKRECPALVVRNLGFSTSLSNLEEFKKDS